MSNFTDPRHCSALSEIPDVIFVYLFILVISVSANQTQSLSHVERLKPPHHRGQGGTKRSVSGCRLPARCLLLAERKTTWHSRTRMALCWPRARLLLCSSKEQECTWRGPVSVLREPAGIWAKSALRHAQGEMCAMRVVHGPASGQSLGYLAVQS